MRWSFYILQAEKKTSNGAFLREVKGRCSSQASEAGDHICSLAAQAVGAQFKPTRKPVQRGGILNPVFPQKRQEFLLIVDW
jgi:hypothetical protein